MSYIDDLREKKLQRHLKPQEARKQEKRELAAFYEKMAERSNGKCEECGCCLTYTINFHPRSHVVHLVPKNKIHGVPSMAMNEDNVVYLCLKHHTQLDTAIDNGFWYIVKGMKIFPIIRERVAKFYHLIPQVEQRRVPSIYIP